MAVHDGHRDRMRERIESSGIGSLQSHEVLEYLLYAFVPRKDTNEIAHNLIDEFGSLSGVFNADAEHLQKVKGVTHNAAVFLSSLAEIFRRYLNDLDKQKCSLKGRGAARSFMGNMLLGENIEVFVVAALDAHDQLISCQKMATGKGDSVNISVRDVVDFALKHQAPNVLIAHNHPSGSVAPSQFDYDLTAEIYSTLASIGVRLEDHFIFAGDEYYSFEEKGKLSAIEMIKEQALKVGYWLYD